MPATPHLLIAFATTPLPACQEALAGLPLPHLRALLARLAPAPIDAGELSDLSLPHERAQARALGLPAADGHIPWAAWEQRAAGRDTGDAPWAWITPCHWVVGRDHITMLAPAQLPLDEDESRAVFAAMQPYFAEDGIALEWTSPTRWLARGEMFRDLPCASLDRVAGRTVDDWLPRTPGARALRRLQQEMQMLLYTHPVNEAREQAGRPPINSFWVSGAGPLTADTHAAWPEGLRVDERLREPALAGDAPAWAAAWQQIDREALQPLLAASQQGQPVTLTLCGERSARTWISSPLGWRTRLSSLLRPPTVAAALEAL